MTNDPNSQAQTIIRQAYAALRQNQRAEARQLAITAARLAPQLEDPWLLLAALAAPQAAVEYAKKALDINPASVRARQAMNWAVKQLRSEPPPVVAPVPLPFAPAPPPVTPQVASPAAHAPAASIPVVPHTPVSAAAGAGTIAAVAQPAAPIPAPPVSIPPVSARITPAAGAAPHKVSWGLVAVLLIVAGLCLGALAWFAWPYVSTVFARSSSAAKPAALLVKPTLTNTPTATYTGTATFTPTFTATFTATFTRTFTATFTATNTASATNTLLPTKTPTKTPTRTQVPTRQPTTPPSVSIPREIQGKQRWIDVDLAHQRAYAYEGGDLIRSFIISTGLARYPTVTGQFHIYVKYRYADMSGPGYYLPDVPYVMYFYDGYGLHGTYWHNNFGTPMSHGCVNFRTEDAGWLFNFAPVGTLVNIH